MHEAIGAYLVSQGIGDDIGRFWEDPDRQRVSALCWLESNGRVLFLCRKKEPFAGYWTAPGGKLKPGESPRDAVVRELWEETGLTISAPTLRAVTSELGGPDYDWLLFLFRAQSYTGELRESSEGELRWVPIGDLERLRMAEADRRLAQLVLGDRAPCFVRVRYGSNHAVTRWQIEPLTAG